MQLQSLRISNFQSFGAAPTELSLEQITYLIGPNGSGKTASLQALCRLFAFDPSLRRITRSDFHVPYNEETPPEERHLWIEANFTFPELQNDTDNCTVAPHFGHMRLDDKDGISRVRFRLNATMGLDGDIEENLVYVLDLNPDGTPLNTAIVPRTERNHIHVHYLPAQRDPADHIAYSTNALLGRMLRAINWENERDTIRSLTDQISDNLKANPSIDAFSISLKKIWEKLHKGSFFTDPKITFVASEIEALLRHMSISFSPGHDETLVDFSRLSDGQKSMLYLSLVLSSQSIGRSVLAEENKSFNPLKLRPPVFTLIALEEPENSLSPLYLGRIVNAIHSAVGKGDAQALIATHAPSMIKRIPPEHIRYLRLSTDRCTKVAKIILPEELDDGHKFVREAVQAFPEIYFSRLVILVEGDSEEIVLPRIFQAKDAPVDESAVTIAPLGGRHVNHFWRLLSALEIPYLTLLDLDIARYGAGWGRIKYVNDQLIKFEPTKALPIDSPLPKWNTTDTPIRTHHFYENGKKDLFTELECRGIFFSFPMDLDFSMLLSYPLAYEITLEVPNDGTIKAVLGKNHHDSSQYTTDELAFFNTYHQLFKIGSKPTAHINALAQLDNAMLLDNIPASLDRLANTVIAKLEELPE